MLAVIAKSNLKMDTMDMEFAAVAKADQVKRGIKYNGLFLVGQEPVQVAAPVVVKPVAKRSFLRIFEEIVFGEATA